MLLLNKLIKEYFDSLAEILSYEGDTYGRIVRHKGLIGSNREEVFYNFLVDHLGNSFDCYRNVQIIDSKGNLSREFDIVVTNRLSMTLNSRRTSIVPVESLVAVFSIKSNLNKDELIDSFDLFKSIPQFSKDVLQVNNGGNYDNFTSNFPVYFVIAFKAASGELIKGECEKYLSSNPDFRISNFNSICVINEYDIHYVHDVGIQRKDIRGNDIKSNQFFLGHIQKHFAGIALIDVLLRISRYSTWFPFLNIDMHEYYKYSYEIYSFDPEK
jgi:hypothetical protein